MIQGIGTGYVPNLYVFNKANPNRDISSPVKPISGINPLSSGSDRVKAVEEDSNFTSAGNLEGLRQTATDAKLQQDYQGVDQASYNMSNPYEASRSMTEGITLSGMNFDQFA